MRISARQLSSSITVSLATCILSHQRDPAKALDLQIDFKASGLNSRTRGSQAVAAHSFPIGDLLRLGQQAGRVVSQCARACAASFARGTGAPHRRGPGPGFHRPGRVHRPTFLPKPSPSLTSHPQIWNARTASRPLPAIGPRPSFGSAAILADFDIAGDEPARLVLLGAGTSRSLTLKPCCRAPAATKPSLQ